MSNGVASRVGADRRVPRHQNRSYSLQRFPEIPDGVAIIPFKDFKESGIQRSPDPDGVERDNLGIPTVELRFKHDTDISKTNPDQNATSAKASFRLGFKKEWWEDWEEGEHLQMHGPYDHSLPRAELFRLAASHFQRFRRFPGDVYKQLWELTFKIYSGIFGTTPVWQKASEQPNEDQNISDDDFEYDDDKPVKFPTHVRPREPYELYDVHPTIVENDEQIQVLLAEAYEKRNARAEKFLADPAKAIQIYLSSYMWSQGLIWSDRNLVNAPHLLRFFVNYLLRNEVFPEKACEDSLRRALDIIELAGKELPLTSKVAKALPDTFSAACRNHWGGNVQGYVTGTDSTNEFESALRAENIEVINSEDALGDADLSMSGGVEDGGWSVEAPTATDWQFSASPTLLTLFGPTALPLTHMPGVVERSVRRIISISAPLSMDKSLLATDAAAVERDLRAQMYSVEMGSWPDWDAEGSEYSIPAILRTHLPSVNTHTVENRITLLVEPAAAVHLCVGMGLGGIWVQLARIVGTHPTGEGEDATSEGLWYLENIMWVLPSYWIAH